MSITIQESSNASPADSEDEIKQNYIRCIERIDSMFERHQGIIRQRLQGKTRNEFDMYFKRRIICYTMGRRRQDNHVIKDEWMFELLKFCRYCYETVERDPETTSEVIFDQIERVVGPVCD